jgi:GntR family transcriptional regulator, transcriptional repressor for pyruvate dehydrogenase complex
VRDTRGKHPIYDEEPRWGARERTLDEHRAILDALASGDPEVARSWATVHIASVEQWLAPVL